jgi:hypothetical protein
MKIRVAAVALGLMMAVVWPATGWAQGDPPESTQPATPWDALPWVGANPLGLTADQLAEVQQIVTEWQAELTPIWTDLQARSLEVERLMMDPASEPAAVAAKIRGIGELQAVIQQKTLERRNAVRSALNGDQRAVFDRQSLGYGRGRGPCGMGLGAGWFGGGWGRGGAMGPGYGRGRGMGLGAAWTGGFGGGRGRGWAMGPGYGWGRGPCGMGLGRGRGLWAGRWPQ